MNYKAISVIADIIGILSLAIIFINSYRTECFNMKEWYLSLTPIFISYLAQFVAIFIEKIREE